MHRFRDPGPAAGGPGIPGRKRPIVDTADDPAVEIEYDGAPQDADRQEYRPAVMGEYQRQGNGKRRGCGARGEQNDGAHTAVAGTVGHRPYPFRIDTRDIQEKVRLVNA